jgi:hypothetical protein
MGLAIHGRVKEPHQRKKSITCNGREGSGEACMLAAPEGQNFPVVVFKIRAIQAWVNASLE